MWICLSSINRYSCNILIKLEISRLISKIHKYHFEENPSLVKGSIECKQTDRQMDKQDEANSRLSLILLTIL